jgi:regulatory protein
MKKKIRVVRKTKTLFIVFENNDPWGILPEKILHFFSFQPDQEITISRDISDQLSEEIVKYAWNKLLNHLSYRERSSYEVRKYLQRLPLRNDIVEKLITKAISYNYLNENRYCELYIRDLQNKSKSKREIYNKLRIKGISTTLIEINLQQFFEQDKESDAIESLVERADKKFSKFQGNVRREKILNYLTRKGFSYWQVMEILNKE